MRRIVFTMFALTFALHVLGQKEVECFYENKVKAEVSLQEGDSIGCRKYLRQAENVGREMNSWDLSAMSYFYFKLGETEKTLSYLKKAVSKGASFTSQSVYANDSIMWKRFMLDYPKLRQEFLSKLDYDLLSKITRMYERDQFCRNYSKKLGGMSAYQLADSVNMIEMTSILQTGGFPSIEQIGQEGTDNFFIVYLHLTTMDKEWDAFHPTLIKALSEGKVKGSEYIAMIDRRLSFQGKKQKYGFVGRNRKIEPIEDIENVDILRAKLGITPLKYYTQKIGVELPDGYVYKSIIEIPSECDKK